MTSPKLLYRRGAPAALLLGLIVGAPDIAQAFTRLGGGGVGLESAPSYIPPSTPYIPPPSSTPTQVPGFTPQKLVPPGLPLGQPIAQPRTTSSGTPATMVPQGPDAGTGPATKGIGDGGAGRGGGGIDLTHAGDDGDATGGLYRKLPAY
jgi:hypothetical protein